jgi:hypothetical protein
MKTLTIRLPDVLAGRIEQESITRRVPMSVADACLVRMSETLPDPVVLTTNTDLKSTAATAARSCPACCREAACLV